MNSIPKNIRNHAAVGIVAGVMLVGAATSAAAQRRSSDRDWEADCERRRSSRNETVCQTREQTLAIEGGRLRVSAEPNGGIEVIGTDRRDARLVARIQAHARTEASAREIIEEIEIHTDGEVRASGPRTGRDEGWSVSFVVEVPRSVDLGLRSQNGGISVEGVAGNLELVTVNGGLSLSQVAGKVNGRTTNGGITARLDGMEWRGEGLDLETTNGGIRLTVPEQYNAELEARTVNGGISFDFPVTVSGRIGRQVRTTMGNGGVLIRVTTTNGGVTVARR